MKGKEIIYFILLVVIVGAGIFGISTVKKWYDGSQQNVQKGQTMEATVGVTKDGTVADAAQGATDTTVVKGNYDFGNTYKEDERHDPIVASRTTRVVPQRVRDNFRARRIARERSGCVGGQCDPYAEAEDASER